VIKPMLCRTWEDATPRPQDYPVYVQPKLDGIRCIVSLQTDGETFEIIAQSRGGKFLVLPKHIEEALLKFYEPEGMDQVVLDGELYAHGLSFQEVASRIKRVVHGTHPDVAVIRYCVYDIVEEDMNWNERLIWLRDNMKYLDSEKGLTMVEAMHSPTEEMVDIHHKTFVELNFEGSIIRLPGGKYEQGKRSRNLLKRKDWKDEDFDITDITEGLGKNAGTAVLTLRSPTGQVFTVTAPGNYEQKALIWAERAEILVTPHICTVKYQELTDDGIPRFPVALGVKEKGT
jgi:DNA ligase 1